MRRFRSLVVALTLLTSPAVSADSSTGVPPDPDVVLRERLLVDYERTRDVSTGCSLGEVERRLGRLADARTHLEAALGAAAWPASETGPETVSACRFNHARVLEALGELREAYRGMRAALETPNAERRRIIETRLVTLASQLAREAGCTALGPRQVATALLRFGDDETLRRCATEVRRRSPFCRRLDADELPDLDDFYAPHRLDDGLVVTGADGELYLLRRRGERVVSGYLCDVDATEERVDGARILVVGSTRLVEIGTQASISFSCDCEPELDAEETSGNDDEPPDDCRCSESGGARYLLTLGGQLVLALVEPWAERESMVTCVEGGEELRDLSAEATRVEGDVIVINGRRLTLRRGFLVPARVVPARR